MDFLHILTCVTLFLSGMFWNREWGAGDSAERFPLLSKHMQMFMWALHTWLVYAASAAEKWGWLIATIGLAALYGGMFLARVWGKSKYYPGEKNTAGEQEGTTWFADPITNAIAGHKDDEWKTMEEKVRWQGIGSGVAWTGSSVVKYGVLAVLVSPWLLLGLVAMPAIGWIELHFYKKFSDPKQDVLRREPAERWTGGFIGAVDGALGLAFA